MSHSSESAPAEKAYTPVDIALENRNIDEAIRLLEDGAPLPTLYRPTETFGMLKAALARGYRFDKEMVDDIAFENAPDTVEKILEIWKWSPHGLSIPRSANDDTMAALLERSPALVAEIRSFPSDSEKRSQLFKRGLVKSYFALLKSGVPISRDEVLTLCASGKITVTSIDRVLLTRPDLEISTLEVVNALLRNTAHPESWRALFTGEVIAHLTHSGTIDNEEIDYITRRALFLKLGVLAKSEIQIETAKRFAVKDYMEFLSDEPLNEVTGTEYIGGMIATAKRYELYFPKARRFIDEMKRLLRRGKEISKRPEVERIHNLEVEELEARFEAKWAALDARRVELGIARYASESEELTKKQSREMAAFREPWRYITFDAQTGEIVTTEDLGKIVDLFMELFV